MKRDWFRPKNLKIRVFQSARSWGFHAFALLILSSIALQGVAQMEPQKKRYADRVETLYDIREAGSLKPSEHKIDAFDPIHLFPVPQSASVGTNDLKNAITVFTFGKDRMRDKSYFHNAVSGMSPGGQYTQLFSKDAIGYGMTRGFTLFDFTHRKFRDYTIHTSIERDIEKVRATDGSKNLFLFWSKEDNPASDNWEDSLSFLRLFDLSGEKPVLHEKRHLQDYETWEVYDKKVFLCDFENNELHVFDSQLKPSNHPLVEIIKNNKENARFAMIVPHPTLPFAVFYGGGYGAQYVCWNQSIREEKIKSIAGDTVSTLYYSFSPDGRWVVFLYKNTEPKRSYLMPISEKYPNYLGSPILLEGDSFDRDHFAWMDNPVSLVGASSGKLLRYDLTKEGHPEAKDALSYWDYVVDKDMEKLRRENKQGLKSNP